MGWFGQRHNTQGTLCPRDATSKNFWSDTSVEDRLTFSVVEPELEPEVRNCRNRNFLPCGTGTGTGTVTC
jgi:hypothetical protein